MAILLLLPLSAPADEALIAVASNFSTVVEELRSDFEVSTSHVIRLSSGSTGVLYAQVVNGAPYDALLAADQARPIRLERNGVGVAGTRFTYAEGRLALWSRYPDVIQGSLQDILTGARLKVLAVANPELAPYGRAAREVLQTAGLQDAVGARFVYGENVSQAFSMAALGNADAGIVALSQVLLTREQPGGHFIEIPADLHAPIRQDAILLQHGVDNEAALEFLAFLQSDPVRARIAALGY